MSNVVFYLRNIQAGCKKCFFEKWADDCAPHRYNLAKITLSQNISEVNACLDFTLKFKLAEKNGGKLFFDKKCKMTLY